MLRMVEVYFSSNIQAIGFDHGVLRVVFHSGSTYDYDDVPEEVFQQFLAASSKGKYFAANVRGHYNARKVS